MRKVKKDPVERPQTKSKRNDASAVWYFYEPFTKEGEKMARCKCGRHECKVIDGSTSNLLRHLRAAHAKEYQAKKQSLEAK